MKKPLLAYSATALLAAAASVGGLAWHYGKAPKFFESPPAQVATATAPAQVAAAPAQVAAAPAQVATAAPPAPIVPQKIVSAPSPTAVEVAKPAPEVVPSFDTVRVEHNGDAVIAGRAAPGADVVAILNGAPVATAKAGADGSFVMIPDKPLPAGTGALTLQTETGGKQIVSDQTVAVDIKPQAEATAATPAPANTVAVLSSDAPTKILQAPEPPSNSVTLDAVDYDAAGNIVFSGRATKQSIVRLYADNDPLGETQVGEDGKWTFAAKSPLAAGNHVLRADNLGAEGKVASRIERPFTREEPAKVAETLPAVAGATKITIQPGNNLWMLSRQLYGAGNRYTVIFEANKDLIRNPDLIYPGQIITAPQKAD